VDFIDGIGAVIARVRNVDRLDECSIRLVFVLALVPLVAFFSFLAIGWALLIVSGGVGWALFRFARQ
jgi:hypothetical protein